MGFRADKTYLSPLYQFYPERQRIPRFEQSYPNVPQGSHEGQFSLCFSNIFFFWFPYSYLQQRPTIILSQTPNDRSLTGGPAAYPQYIRHLERAAKQLHASPGGMDDFAQGYWDWLQAPLQPLMDDLQSSTYEVFERDPVKYRNYEEAVVQALKDRPAVVSPL